MPSIRKVRLFRLLEKASLLVFIIWTGGVSVLFGLGELSGKEIVAGVGVSVLILILIVVIQKTIDSWLDTFFLKENYAQEDIFNSLYERSPVGYLTLDKNGLVNISNPASVNLLQGEVGSFNDVNFYSLLGVDPKMDLEVLKSKVEAGMTVNDEEVLIQTLEGQLVWVMMSVVPYRNTDKRLVSLVDVTDKKNIDTAKSEFVALATHQLRTPIAAIRWNVELLTRSLKEIKTESQARYLSKIDRNVLRMIDLINDFLSVSKLEMGTYASNEEDINLTEFFSSITEEFSEKITEKQLTLDRQDEPPQVIVRFDKRLIHIVVSNLVSNAVKYSNVGGILTFSYKVTGNSLQLVVADNGIGVPEGELSNLFSKFYRASNAQNHQTEGTGLGLYIVKQSVEKMGGQISVESSENEGAKFVVDLPIS